MPEFKFWNYLLSVGIKNKYTYFYMASVVIRQDESNPALWLATRAGKMEPSCLLGTTRRVPQEKFPWKPDNKSFIDQACSVKMAGYWPLSFFASLWTSTPSRSINTQKRTWPISSHLDLTLMLSITHTCRPDHQMKVSVKQMHLKLIQIKPALGKRES